MNVIAPKHLYRYSWNRRPTRDLAISIISREVFDLKETHKKNKFLIPFVIFLSMILLGSFRLIPDLPNVIADGFILVVQGDEELSIIEDQAPLSVQADIETADHQGRSSDPDVNPTFSARHIQEMRAMMQGRSSAMVIRSQMMQDYFDGGSTIANSNDEGGSHPAPTSTQNPTSSEVRFDEGDIVRLPMEDDYHSQVTETPLPNACGPTALLIALDYFDIEQSLGTVIEKFQFPPQQGGFDPNCSLNPVCTSPGALVQVAQEEYGLLVDAHEGWTFEEIQESIAAGVPVIADIVWRLADEGPAHFIVIYGVNVEEQILYYHDPYDGAEKEASWEQFSTAWDGPLDMGDPLQPQGHRYWGMGVAME
jgi:hypothetical protein